MELGEKKLEKGQEYKDLCFRNLSSKTNQIYYFGKLALFGIQTEILLTLNLSETNSILSQMIFLQKN